jgi:DinB superfamily
MANVIEFSLPEASAILERTPAVLDAQLRGLSDLWVRSNEGPETWNPFDIVGHLVYAERADWMPRIHTLLEFGESRPFDPFDRFAQLKESQGKSLEDLLDKFARLRSENLVHLKALDLKMEDLSRRGLHPSLGAVTLSHLLATWATHDLNHLHQLARVMAGQYREAVGPWNIYLGVLKCNGHSSSS